MYRLLLVRGNKEGEKIEASEAMQELLTVKSKGAKLVVEIKAPKNTSLNVNNRLKV